MRLLPNLLFVASVTISIIIDTEAMPDDKHKQSSLFNPDQIKDALGTVDENTKFSEVFVKILTGVKKGSLNATNAEIFINKLIYQRTAYKTNIRQYLKIFLCILQCYNHWKDIHNEEIARHFARRSFHAFLFDNTKKEEFYMSQKIAPFVAKLIVYEGHIAHLAAKDIVDILLKDPVVTKEVGVLFKASTDFDRAYELLKEVINLPEIKAMTCDEHKPSSLFNPDQIKDALGTVDKKTEFHEVFVKILTGVKKGTVNATNAEIFINKGERAENMTEVFVRRSFHAILYDETQKEQFNISKRIAPFVAKLILNEGFIAEQAAIDIINILLTDPVITEEVGVLFKASPTFDPAYQFLKEVINLPEQE